MHTFLQVVTKYWMHFRYSITIIGLENVPANEELIVVSPHRTVTDSYLVPVAVGRKLIFMAKEEYFKLPGLKGRVRRWLLSYVAVPVNRDSAASRGRALLKLVAKLREGSSVGLHPEGTRTPTRAIYKGMPGAVIMAWKSGKRMLPVVILGLDEPKQWWSRPKVTVTIGEPLIFVQPERTEVSLTGISTRDLRAMNQLEQDKQTKKLMLLLASMTGWPYIDEYATDVKERMVA